MTKKSKTQAKRVPTLKPQPHGGALWAGPAAHPVAGPGRPRNELRVLLRDFAWEKFPDFRAKWEVLTPDQQVRALELALKYGLGTQTEQLSPEEGKERLVRVLAVFGRYALDAWGRSREEVNAALHAMEAAWNGTE